VPLSALDANMLKQYLRMRKLGALPIHHRIQLLECRKNGSDSTLRQSSAVVTDSDI
jgi:hypothetical protein